MHKVTSTIRRITAAEIPSTDPQALLNMGIVPLGNGYYSCREQENDIPTGKMEPVVVIDLRPDVEDVRLHRRTKDSRSTALRRAGFPPVVAGLLRETGADDPKAVPLLLTGPAPIDRAISTAGGVALHEIDDRFMLVKHPGTFVAGEMLDWEAPTGGYLLTGCLATGRWAGGAAAARIAGR